jgi:ribosome biogenesis SPOUT family RNA methylase Rps3
LDSGVHILKPEEVKKEEDMVVENIMDDDPQQREAETKKAKEGEDLDRVFGGLQV